MRFLIAVSIGLSLAQFAHAADGSLRRFAVIAGASLGGPGRTPLRYATTDARDVSRVLRRLGGVALGDLVLLEEPDADQIRSSITSVAAEADRARRAGRRVELFLYYSGHSDEEGLLLASSRLPYAELRRELAAVPADVRVAILDSCASGAFTRAKGGVHRPPFLVDESSRVQGHAFLTSSAAGEAAQESDRLRASFFTHALVTGLRGAADASGDGLVTLNEAYQFAFRETLAGTEATQGGPQHATYDIGLVGSGDVVMTDLRRADALLVLPETLDGRVFVRNSAGQLVAELRKARGARVDLAVEEGRYDVRVAREQRVLAGTLDVRASERVVLDDTRLSDVPLEASASRGQSPSAGPLGGAEPPSRFASPSPPVARNAPFLAPSYLVTVRGGSAVSRRPGSPAGFQGEVAASVWFGGFVGVEVSSGILRVDGRTDGRLPGSGGSFLGDVRDEVTAVPTRVTLELGLPTAPIRPYLLGGAGVTALRVDRYAARDYPQLAPGARHLRDDAVFFSLHAGAGAAVRITTRFSATLEARYLFGSAEVLQERVPMDVVSAAAGVAWTF